MAERAPLWGANRRAAGLCRGAVTVPCGQSGDGLCHVSPGWVEDGRLCLLCSLHCVQFHRRVMLRCARKTKSTE